MEARQRYRLLGVALIVGGAAVGAMAWFVLDYKPLVALGISSLILGAVSMALARSLSRLSGDASLLMLRAGLDNVSALVEELGLREKALYLPTSLTQGRARAYLPSQKLLPTGPEQAARVPARRPTQGRGLAANRQVP